MEKIKTFTLDFGNGEMNLIDTSMASIASELEAVDLKDYDDFLEVTIRIEKKYTQKDLEELPDYC